MQWALLCLAAASAVLVVLFKLQGSKLHKAQVDLLQAHYGRKMDEQDNKVEAARERYLKARESYEEHK